MRKVKRCFALFVALLLGATVVLSGCNSGDGGKTENPKQTYPKEIWTEKYDGYSFREVYIYNEEEERKIYGAEYIPDGASSGNKVPCILMMHGASGNITTFDSEAKKLMPDNIAIFMIEACGANPTTPKSDGRDMQNVHISSRVSDLMTAIDYVRTLDYVDQNRVYLYGRSMGGVNVMIAGGFFTNGEFPGIIVESSGLGPGWEGMLNVRENSQYVVDKYAISSDEWEDWVVKYPGDVLFVCAEYDEENAFPAAEYAYEVYKKRDKGETVFVGLYHPDSRHTWNTFEDNDKIIALDAIRDFVLG